ncbi:MAG: Fe-S cluster assembly protein SufD [Gammaproteobacteria bacterium]
MNNSRLEPVERYRELLDGAAAALPGHDMDWLSGRRALAVKQFMERGFPTRKDESWRYTSLERILDQDWNVPDAAFSALTDLDIEDFLLASQAAARLVFANGRWVEALSDTAGLGDGVRLGSLRRLLDTEPALLERHLGSVADAGASAFGALNTALIDDGVYLRIPAGVRLERPIEVLYLTIGQDAAPMVQPRNLIVLEADAAVTLVEHHAGLGGDSPYFSNGLTEIVLGERAQLEHALLQDQGPAARHLGQIHVQQGMSSHYRGLAASLGGLWSRIEYHNRMTQPQARCELDGLYLAGDRQLSDVHLNITHAVPDCRSRERFKGLLTGRGRAVFDGLIRVEPDAQRTDAQLVNDNLLLSRDAEIDTKPQLEIYADDVKCSHGTTVGQLEPDQLFYLRARGIGAEAARRMLCAGFALEILENCSVAGLRERVERRLRERLSAAPAAAPATP